ncbi:hypothetical protein FRC01_008038, partial [Tulasnella sp. 417]
EAINALLQGPDNLTIDDGDQAESQGQYQRLKRRSDVLESQLEILKAAKKHVDQACNPEPLERIRATLPSSPSTELLILELQGVGVRKQWRTEIGQSSPAGQRNPALDDHILKWTQKTIESVTRNLFEGQLDDGTDGECIPSWSSPVMTGPVIVRDHLQKHISLLEERLADARWRQNNLIPIARLPPEILIDVFDFVLEEGQRYWRDDTNTLLTVLSPVCRDWAGIIDTTPRLWNHISPYRSTMNHVDMALDKSKDSPLTIHFSECHSDHRWSDDFFNSIKRHAGRWKSLELHLCSSHALHTINLQFANLLLPRLERLQVSLDYQWGGMQPFEIEFIGNLWPDPFRHLWLDDIGLPARSFAELRGLKSLAMWPRLRGEVKIGDIIRILSECPALEELILGEEIALKEEPASGYLDFGPAVRLDHLREISLWLRPAPLHALLRSIQAENCTKFRIATTLPPEGGGGTWTEMLLTDEIRPFIRTVESVLRSAYEIHIEAGSHSVILETKPRDGQSGVYWRFRGGQGAEVGRWLAESLSLGRAPITLDITPNDAMWIEILPLVLFTFYSTVNLTLCGNHAVCQQVIDFLGTPLCDDPAGYQYFPMPRLTFLTVPIECHPAVISMLRQRYGQPGSKDPTNTRPPAKISKLGLLRDNSKGTSFCYTPILK